PDRFREFRGKSRTRKRAAAASFREAARVALAARPFGFDGAAEHRRRARSQPARLRVLPQGPGQARGGSRANARGPGGQLGSARRSGADGDAPLWPSRSLRAAQGAHARQAGGRRSDARFHPRPRAARGREGAAAQTHACRLHRQGRRARSQDLKPGTDHGFPASGYRRMNGKRENRDWSPALRWVLAAFGGVYFVTGLVRFIFAASGPVAIILAVGTRGGLAPSDLSSWIFGAFFVNGLISIAFCWLYRQPLVFFWTIPGAVLVGPALGHLSYAEVIGAFIATGILMLALGLSGWVRRAMEAVPMPIVMGELVVPLAITVLVVQNGQGITVLRSAGHAPPIDAVAAACGAGSIVTAFVGAVSTCLTGPVNAIISSSGERRRHYAAGIFVGLLALAFGLFAPFFTGLMLAAPKAFIAALAGLAMLRVLQTAFTVSFRD